MAKTKKPKPKSTIKSKPKASKNLMPSGKLKGGGGSYAERMSMADFNRLAAPLIETAKADAKDMGISLRPSTFEIDNKVRRIVKASGFHFSENEGHVVVAIKIAATAMAMLGGEPDPINLQSVLKA